MAGLSLLATACTEQEQTTPQGDPTSLRVTISDDEAATRSIVIDNPGIKLESFWKGNDKIGVFGTSAQNVVFSVSEASISADGKTADFNSTYGLPTGPLTAYYPYISNASQTGDQLVLDFPAVQHYTTVGGVPQPDSEVCFMAGKGSIGSGISFVNIMSVLKVSQAFESETQVRRVEFRDLSGAPVCGAFTVSFDGNTPEATFTGEGSVLALDLGAEGQTAYEGSLFNVFLVVPARNYPKGFEITFVAVDGQQTVRTVGSRDGKVLKRSVVYPVGDVVSYANVPGISYELKPTTQVMTPDKLDMISLISTERSYVVTDDGTNALDADGNPVVLPCLNLRVHKDMNPQVGGYLVFNNPTTDIPQGGVFKIEQCTKMSDGVHYEVKAVPESNFAAPFQSLVIGEPLYDAEGNLNPDAGVDVDISSYIKEIRDGEGNLVSTRSIPTYDTNTAEALTRSAPKRGTARHTYTAPPLTLSMDDGDHCTCDVSAQMSLGVRIAVGVIAGELQYIYTTVNPKLKLKTTFGLYGKVEKSKRQHLLTLYTTGIPIGPIVVIPEITFDMLGGVGGELKFTASTTFNYDLGTYGLAYNKGQGLTYRHTPTPPEKDESFSPQLESELTGSLYAFGGIGMKVGLSVYAMCSLGAATDAKLTFGIHNDYLKGGVKLALTPEVAITPYTAVLGGRLSKLWEGLSGKIELDPIWERYIIPNMYGPGAEMALKLTEPRSISVVDEDGFKSSISGLQISYGADIGYDIMLSGKPFNDWDVVVNVYEGNNYTHFWDIFNTDPKNRGFYASNGILHLIDPNVFITNPRFIKSVKVGEYTTQDDSLRIEGHIEYPFESGVPYALVAGLEFGETRYPDPGPQDTYFGSTRYNGLTGKIFFWPNRSNGDPY